MKKKLLSFMLIAAMVLGMSTTAMAEGTTETYGDMQTVTITKTYKETNEGTTSPAETFGFTELEFVEVKDAGVEFDENNVPTPTITNVSYNAGEAGSETAAKKITITLPKYDAVGIYTYTFNEENGDTAGVTYYGKEIKLVVTVIEQGGKVRVAAVHTEGEGEAKSDDFANEYSAGSLTVGKTVTGILGDKTKGFTVTVTFTAPEGKTVKEAITYADGTEAIAANWDGTKEVKITLKHGEEITFNNIPYGVTYTVVEDDYKAEGYDTATYEYSDKGDVKNIDSATEKVEITNNKNGHVDTGLIINNMPYIVMLALVCGAVVLFVMNRRRRMEF